MRTTLTTTTRRTTRAALAAGSALALAVALTACGTDDAATDTAAGAGTSLTSAVGDAGTDTADTDTDGAHGEAPVELTDGWAKATDGDMTGVFGVLRNTGDEDVTLVGVSGDLGERQELHEMVPGGSGMMMREKEDGFVLPAGGELVLEPGGNHIMLMDLDGPVTPGQEITLTLEFADGGTRDVTVSARAFAGGEEQYEPADDHGEGMSHDG